MKIMIENWAWNAETLRNAGILHNPYGFYYIALELPKKSSLTTIIARMLDFYCLLSLCD